MRVDAGVGNTSLGRFDGQVAGGNPLGHVPPLVDAGSLHNPIGVVSQHRQVLVLNRLLGHISAHADDADAHQFTQPRLRNWGQGIPLGLRSFCHLVVSLLGSSSILVGMRFQVSGIR